MKGSNAARVGTSPTSGSPGTNDLVLCSQRQLLLYFLRLGALGFGGPIALVGYMEQDLVERRRWFSRQDYLEGLTLAQLAPGPLAAQLAIIPFLHSGVVDKFGWLHERQFLDAVAVALITPGPVVITVGFIGYLVAGVVGAILAALGIILRFKKVPDPLVIALAGFAGLIVG